MCGVEKREEMGGRRSRNGHSCDGRKNWSAVQLAWLMMLCCIVMRATHGGHDLSEESRIGIKKFLMLQIVSSVLSQEPDNAEYQFEFTKTYWFQLADHEMCVAIGVWSQNHSMKLKELAKKVKTVLLIEDEKAENGESLSPNLLHQLKEHLQDSKKPRYIPCSNCGKKTVPISLSPQKQENENSENRDSRIPSSHLHEQYASCLGCAHKMSIPTSLPPQTQHYGLIKPVAEDELRKSLNEVLDDEKLEAIFLGYDGKTPTRDELLKASEALVLRDSIISLPPDFRFTFKYTSGLEIDLEQVY